MEANIPPAGKKYVRTVVETVQVLDDVPAPAPGPAPTPVPVPVPGPTPTPAPSGYDLTTNGALMSGFNGKLDANGTPDGVTLSTLGAIFDYFPEIAGFVRGDCCFKWECGVVALDDGDYVFTAQVKSGGFIVWDGDPVWEIDREGDPGGHTHFDVKFTKTLKRGQLYPVVAELVEQGGEHVFQLQWQRPGQAAAQVIPALQCHPPLGWQQRLKTFAPPPPPPPPPPQPLPPAGAAPSPNLLGLKFLADSSAFYTDKSAFPVDPNSAKYLTAYDPTGTAKAHADFDGVGGGYPINVVDSTVAKVAVAFDIADESDAGPYPIPPWVVVENGFSTGDSADHHCIIYDKDAKKIYEMFQLGRDAAGNYHAYAGSVFDCTKGDLQRPLHNTSTDAAGMPELPGLVKYDEAQAGSIGHALILTVPKTRKAFCGPASHWASADTSDTYLPMGACIRLKASYDVTQGGTASPAMQNVLKDWQKYGAFVHDNGALWHVQGNGDVRWGTDPNSQETVNVLRKVTTNDLEVLALGPLTTA